MINAVQFATCSPGRRARSRATWPASVRRFFAVADKAPKPAGGITIACPHGYVEVRAKRTGELLHRELFDETLATEIALVEAKARLMIANARDLQARHSIRERLEQSRNPRLRGHQ